MYKIEDLFERYKTGHCSPDEAVYLLSKFADPTFHAELVDLLDKEMLLELAPEDRIAGIQDLSNAQYAVIAAEIFPPKDSKIVAIYQNPWAWVAAASIMLLSYFGYQAYKFERPSPLVIEQVVNQPSSSANGPEGITLTLPSGEVINLSDSMSEQYASTANEDGLALYELKEQAAAKQALVQRVNVPFGKTAVLLLTDGTKVWLNADTKLEYDVNFIGNTRLVKLEGEAYFEVMHDREKPFVVESQGQQVKVLGTHFNVKAYKDSKTVTTLLEGQVEVRSARHMKILMPGECSILAANYASMTTGAVDFNEVKAWRKQEFAFFDAALGDIAEELSRWYGVEVRVIGRSGLGSFTGMISRKKSLEEVLEILKRTGQIKYQIIPSGIQERRVILMM